MPNIRLTVLSSSAAEIRGRLLYQGPGTTLIQGGGVDNYVCGRCGSVLVAGIEGVPELVNGCLKCNACEAFNDLSRTSKHDTLPLMFQDIVSQPKPQLKEWLDEMWRQSPHTHLLEDLHAELKAPWLAAQGAIPDQLFHYTSSKGLRGILSSHQLWATDMGYMNDSSELQYGIDIVNKHLESHIATADGLKKELLVRSRVSSSPQLTRGDFVTCFCEDGDLLSQWRAYASSGTGYSIGFNARAFVHHNQPILRRVIYDKNVQDSFVSSTISTCADRFLELAAGRSIKDLDADYTIAAFASFLGSRLTEYIYTFKNPGFREEAEWRLVFHAFRSKDFMPHLRYRDDMLSTPFIPVGFRNPAPSPQLLPILEVKHGPSVHPALAKKSLLLMLESFGYDHVEALGAATSLRA